jgi:UDP-N-acetylglucosamine acyltransferase
MTIHPTAIIDPRAVIAPGVTIGPWTLVGPYVEIQEGTQIHAHVVIEGPTVIGKNNCIYSFAAIGGAPQDKKYHGEATQLIIGDSNIFRESCTIHRGTVHGGDITRIGNHNLFMAYTHVAHDCIVGDHVTFSNSAAIAGHVKVGDYSILGGMVGVHQFCTIGSHSFAAGGSIILKDVPPYVLVSGYPAKAHGLNTVGLERQGFTSEMIMAIRRAYRVVFRQGLTLQEAISELKETAEDTEQAQHFLGFLINSARGIVR